MKSELMDVIDALGFKKIVVYADNKPAVSWLVDGDNAHVLKFHIVDGTNVTHSEYYWVDHSHVVDMINGYMSLNDGLDSATMVIHENITDGVSVATDVTEKWMTFVGLRGIFG